eukprot:NODE_15727_length_414_cov_41.116838_g15415_i0.p1 GENE.NODE_15727_length_414_cov_41.116838_g15415_i0~~NODE_15727_length_414_cov_41.116838_g15415_i0.p1  ORF type:complete len:118 (-),score=24.95 NODE_15727_length_414_cov_41.116838_g15415_i0:5-358(-)
MADQISAVSLVLQNSFNPDKAARKQAEDALKQYRSQPQFAQLLLHLIAAVGPDDAVKQAAAVYFKNLARNCWDPREDFHIGDNDKAEVRRVVVDCMISCKSPKIRTILSDAIARTLR